MSTDLIKTYNVESQFRDIKDREKRDFQYGHFCWVEECIVVLLYRKENEEMLKELLKIHEKWVKHFKKELKLAMLKRDSNE